jgi:DNA-binding MarR family transcriptional regulator
MDVDSNDRRSKQVNITEQGRKLRNEAIAKANEALDNLVNRIDQSEIDEALERLQHIRQLLDADRN